MFDRLSLTSALAAHGRVARVVIADVKGSAPREAGTSMLVWADGFSGTIGGGRLEFEAITSARSLLSKAARPVVTKVALGPGLGQCCGGACTLVTEVFDDDRMLEISGDYFIRPIAAKASDPPGSVQRKLANGADFLWQDGWLVERIGSAPQPVFIYGAGHVGRALAAMLDPMKEFDVTLADTREEWRDGLPKTCADPFAAMAQAPEDAAHFIMTHDHDQDFALCHAALQRGLTNVGLIGSGTKWARFQKRLASLGHGADEIAGITCPIGDPSLGKSPNAIAVGVAATLLRGRARGMSAWKGTG